MRYFTFEDFLPQGEEILTLQKNIRNGKMSHALLITGENGTGKRTLSKLLAAALLCIEEGSQPCGKCKGCIRVHDNEHPDMICIEKGVPLSADGRKNKTTIPIDDIREMISLSSRYPLLGGNRIIVINNAEDMTIQAQNCLLKILEEPPSNTYFILTSAHPEQLLVTVRSRCQVIKMKPWNKDLIISILTNGGINPDKARIAAETCNGSIGYAKQLAENEDYWKMREDIIKSFFGTGERSRILSISTYWKDKRSDAETIFGILDECVRILLQYRITKKEDERLSAFSDEWKSFAAKADYKRFLFLFDKIRDGRKQYGFNVSIQAIIEQLLLCFMGEIQK